MTDVIIVLYSWPWFASGESSHAATQLTLPPPTHPSPPLIPPSADSLKDRAADSVRAAGL